MTGWTDNVVQKRDRSDAPQFIGTEYIVWPHWVRDKKHKYAGCGTLRPSSGSGVEQDGEGGRDSRADGYCLGRQSRGTSAAQVFEVT